MSNRRRRNKRKINLIIETISTKTFITISSILLIVILASIAVNILLHKKEMQKIAQEQERISQHVEDIYTSVEADLNELNNYKSNSIVRISAIGDILFGNNMARYGANEDGNYTNIFSDIKGYMKDSDIVVGTYEHVINESNKVFANAVKEAKVNLVTLAHNHALDNGENGLNFTKEYLEKIGIETIGIYSEESKDRVKIQEKKGMKLAFLTYTYDNGTKGINIYNEETVKQDLEYAEENADFSVVLMHWGDVNKNEPNNTQRVQAKFLIDNGADLIIGAHPSALQPMEIIQNSEGQDCLIAYSLGDFTSDFESENSNLELILNVQLFYNAEENKVSLYKVDYVPVYMNDYGSKQTVNRYKLLDIKNEIANYGIEGSTLDKETYDKLVRGIDRLNSIIKK